MADIEFERGGRRFACSRKARLLLEEANGTSSYTFVGGYTAFSNAEVAKALEAFDGLPLGGSKRKRLTLVDQGKRVVVATEASGG